MGGQTEIIIYRASHIIMNFEMPANNEGLFTVTVYNEYKQTAVSLASILQLVVWFYFPCSHKEVNNHASIHIKLS